VPENIDAVLELIMQDRHVACREIELDKSSIQFSCATTTYNIDYRLIKNLPRQKNAINSWTILCNHFSQRSTLIINMSSSKKNKKNWFDEFNRCWRSLEDKRRKGFPKAVVVPQNIDAVRELIMQDRHVQCREIEGISLRISSSIHSILH